MDGGGAVSTDHDVSADAGGGYVGTDHDVSADNGGGTVSTSVLMMAVKLLAPITMSTA